MAQLRELLGEANYNGLPEDVRKRVGETDLVDSSNYVAKETYNQTVKDRDNYKGEVGKRDKQIDTLSKQIKDNEELQNEIETLKTDNAKALKDLEEQTEKTLFDTALGVALKSFDAKNPTVLKGLLDLNKLKRDGDNIIGLKEQVEAIKKTDEYLFEKEIPGGGKIDTTQTNQELLGGAAPNNKKEPLGVRLAKQRTSGDTNKTLEQFIRR